jgi:hypothetical protein
MNLKNSVPSKLDSSSERDHFFDIACHVTDSADPKDIWTDNFISHSSDSKGQMVTELIYDQKMEALESRLDQLEKEIIRVKSIVDDTEPQEIHILDIPYEKAKGEIELYFRKHHGESIDASDIQEELGIDIFMAIDILDELENEGKIKPL